MDHFGFELLARDPDTQARAGRLTTPHGTVETPTFMAVGTRATVKGITPDQLAEAGAQIVLGNTYHLTLQPGDQRIAQLGGLHQFMRWPGPILTDSGGFQVFSLQTLRKVDDNGVSFKSHIDGSPLTMSPESATRIQENLGSDIAMCFDECPPAKGDPAVVERAVTRTTAWAARCQAAHQRRDQVLFAIVQGGLVEELRRRSAAELVALDFPGYALGGLSVGETPEEMYAVLDYAAPLLPEMKPRYLMGVGRPEDLLEAVARGIDMFDCVMPTRNGRNATAHTSQGRVRLRNAKHADDPGPLDPQCACYCCRHFSRAYLRHLFAVDEMLGPTLVSIHNLAFYFQLMAGARAAIMAGRYADYRRQTLAAFDQAA